MRAARAQRVARGGLTATSSVLIAALSHMAAGGANPGLLGVGLSLVFAVLACIALAGRRLSTVRLSIAVALSQFVFHVLFSLGAALPSQVSSQGAGAGASAATGGEAGAMLGMVMSGGRSASSAVGGASSTSMVGMNDLTMWVGHGIAAVLTIALLLQGGRAFSTLVRIAGGRLALLVAVVLDLPEALAQRRHVVARVVADRSGLPALDVLLASRPRRGPPLGTAR